MPQNNKSSNAKNLTRTRVTKTRSTMFDLVLSADNNKHNYRYTVHWTRTGLAISFL